jgi:mono/diheme cytochrome c family protein
VFEIPSAFVSVDLRSINMRLLFTTTLLFAAVSAVIAHAQSTKASPRERAGAEVFGQHCSVCHGVRLLKEDAAHDLVAYVKTADEAAFVRASKTRRGAMPTFENLLTDQQISDIYAYVKRGHTPDLNDVRMESNH